MAAPTAPDEKFNKLREENERRRKKKEEEDKRRKQEEEQKAKDALERRRLERLEQDERMRKPWQQPPPAKKPILRKGAKQKPLQPPSPAAMDDMRQSQGEAKRKEWRQGLQEFLKQQRQQPAKVPGGPAGATQAAQGGGGPVVPLTWEELRLAAEAGFDELLAQQEMQAEQRAAEEPAARAARHRSPFRSPFKGAPAPPQETVQVSLVPMQQYSVLNSGSPAPAPAANKEAGAAGAAPVRNSYKFSDAPWTGASMAAVAAATAPGRQHEQGVTVNAAQMSTDSAGARGSHFDQFSQPRMVAGAAGGDPAAQAVLYPPQQEAYGQAQGGWENSHVPNGSGPQVHDTPLHSAAVSGALSVGSGPGFSGDGSVMGSEAGTSVASSHGLRRGVTAAARHRVAPQDAASLDSTGPWAPPGLPGDSSAGITSAGACGSEAHSNNLAPEPSAAPPPQWPPTHDGGQQQHSDDVAPLSTGSVPHGHLEASQQASGTSAAPQQADDSRLAPPQSGSSWRQGQPHDDAPPPQQHAWQQQTDQPYGQLRPAPAAHASPEHRPARRGWGVPPQHAQQHQELYAASDPAPPSWVAATSAAGPPQQGRGLDAEPATIGAREGDSSGPERTGEVRKPSAAVATDATVVMRHSIAVGDSGGPDMWQRESVAQTSWQQPHPSAPTPEPGPAAFRGLGESSVPQSSAPEQQGADSECSKLPGEREAPLETSHPHDIAAAVYARASAEASQSSLVSSRSPVAREEQRRRSAASPSPLSTGPLAFSLMGGTSSRSSPLRPAIAQSVGTSQDSARSSETGAAPEVSPGVSRTASSASLGAAAQPAEVALVQSREPVAGLSSQCDTEPLAAMLQPSASPPRTSTSLRDMHSSLPAEEGPLQPRAPDSKPSTSSRSRPQSGSSQLPPLPHGFQAAPQLPAPAASVDAQTHLPPLLQLQAPIRAPSPPTSPPRITTPQRFRRQASASGNPAPPVTAALPVASAGSTASVCTAQPRPKSVEPVELQGATSSAAIATALPVPAKQPRQGPAQLPLQVPAQASAQTAQHSNSAAAVDSYAASVSSPRKPGIVAATPASPSRYAPSLTPGLDVVPSEPSSAWQTPVPAPQQRASPSSQSQPSLRYDQLSHVQGPQSRAGGSPASTAATFGSPVTLLDSPAPSTAPPSQQRRSPSPPPPGPLQQPPWQSSPQQQQQPPQRHSSPPAQHLDKGPPGLLQPGADLAAQLKVQASAVLDKDLIFGGNGLPPAPAPSDAPSGYDLKADSAVCTGGMDSFGPPPGTADGSVMSGSHISARPSSGPGCGAAGGSSRAGSRPTSAYQRSVLDDSATSFDFRLQSACASRPASAAPEPPSPPTARVALPAQPNEPQRQEQQWPGPPSHSRQSVPVPAASEGGTAKTADQSRQQPPAWRQSMRTSAATSSQRQQPNAFQVLQPAAGAQSLYDDERCDGEADQPYYESVEDGDQVSDAAAAEGRTAVGYAGHADAGAAIVAPVSLAQLGTPDPALPRAADIAAPVPATADSAAVADAAEPAIDDLLREIQQLSALRKALKAEFECMGHGEAVANLGTLSANFTSEPALAPAHQATMGVAGACQPQEANVPCPGVPSVQAPGMGGHVAIEGQHLVVAPASQAIAPLLQWNVPGVGQGQPSTTVMPPPQPAVMPLSGPAQWSLPPHSQQHSLPVAPSQPQPQLLHAQQLPAQQAGQQQPLLAWAVPSAPPASINDAAAAAITLAPSSQLALPVVPAEFAQATSSDPDPVDQNAGSFAFPPAAHNGQPGVLQAPLPVAPPVLPAPAPPPPPVSMEAPLAGHPALQWTIPAAAPGGRAASGQPPSGASPQRTARAASGSGSTPAAGPNSARPAPQTPTRPQASPRMPPSGSAAGKATAGNGAERADTQGRGMQASGRTSAPTEVAERPLIREGSYAQAAAEARERAEKERVAREALQAETAAAKAAALNRSKSDRGIGGSNSRDAKAPSSIGTYVRQPSIRSPPPAAAERSTSSSRAGSEPPSATGTPVAAAKPAWGTPTGARPAGSTSRIPAPPSPAPARGSTSSTPTRTPARAPAAAAAPAATTTTATADVSSDSDLDFLERASYGSDTDSPDVYSGRSGPAAAAAAAAAMPPRREAFASPARERLADARPRPLRIPASGAATPMGGGPSTASTVASHAVPTGGRGGGGGMAGGRGPGGKPPTPFTAAIRELMGLPGAAPLEAARCARAAGGAPPGCRLAAEEDRLLASLQRLDTDMLRRGLAAAGIINEAAQPGAAKPPAAAAKAGGAAACAGAPAPQARAGPAAAAAAAAAAAPKAAAPGLRDSVQADQLRDSLERLDERLAALRRKMETAGPEGAQPAAPPARRDAASKEPDRRGPPATLAKSRTPTPNKAKAIRDQRQQQLSNGQGPPPPPARAAAPAGPPKPASAPTMPVAGSGADQGRAAPAISAPTSAAAAGSHAGTAAAPARPPHGMPPRAPPAGRAPASAPAGPDAAAAATAALQQQMQQQMMAGMGPMQYAMGPGGTPAYNMPFQAMPGAMGQGQQQQQQQVAYVPTMLPNGQMAYVPQYVPSGAFSGFAPVADQQQQMLQQQQQRMQQMMFFPGLPQQPQAPGPGVPVMAWGAASGDGSSPGAAPHPGAHQPYGAAPHAAYQHGPGGPGTSPSPSARPSLYSFDRGSGSGPAAPGNGGQPPAYQEPHVQQGQHPGQQHPPPLPYMTGPPPNGPLPHYHSTVMRSRSIGSRDGEAAVAAAMAAGLVPHPSHQHGQHNAQHAQYHYQAQQPQQPQQYQDQHQRQSQSQHGQPPQYQQQQHQLQQQPQYDLQPQQDQQPAHAAHRPQVASFGPNGAARGLSGGAWPGASGPNGGGGSGPEGGVIKAVNLGLLLS